MSSQLCQVGAEGSLNCSSTVASVVSFYIPPRHLHVGSKKGKLPLTASTAEIRDVLCNGQKVAFVLRNFLEQPVTTPEGGLYDGTSNFMEPQTGAATEPVDGRTFAVFHKAAQAASDEGELIIDLPDEEQHLPDAADTHRISSVVQIYYELVSPRGGIHFTMPNDHAYTKRAPRTATSFLSKLSSFPSL